MPWKETCTMDQRRAFIEAWLSREFIMAAAVGRNSEVYCPGSLAECAARTQPD